MELRGVSLDEMRLVADPVVDDVVSHFVAQDPRTLGRVLKELFRSTELPTKHPLVAAYLEAVPRVELGDRTAIARGQRLFGVYAPDVLVTLGTYSLPLVYASGNGVQTIYRTRRLKEDAYQRLFDTAQFVVNCMQPGQLEDGGLGWVSIRKVRLVHAIARQLLLADEANPWPMKWGVPINQEDQAATLLTFSVAALDGLRKMGAVINDDDATAYVHAWSAIGRLLGVHEALLASNESGGRALAGRIARRQLRPTREGKELTEQLTLAMDTLFPFRGYASSLAHFFLTDSVFGPDVARILQLPPPNWTQWLVKTKAKHNRNLAPLLDAVPGARERRSFFAGRFAQSLLFYRRPGEPTPFAISEDLMPYWPFGKGG